MESTHTQGKSYFRDDVDVQGLLDKYAGTGQLMRTAKGQYKNTELVKDVSIRGKVIDKAGVEHPITGITIHHSSKRTHIVPYAGKE
nr:polymorphic toxin type 50 domain-containing protein [Lactobacillus sp. CBA3605]